MQRVILLILFVLAGLMIRSRIVNEPPRLADISHYTPDPEHHAEVYFNDQNDCHTNCMTDPVYTDCRDDALMMGLSHHHTGMLLADCKKACSTCQ